MMDCKHFLSISGLYPYTVDSVVFGSKVFYFIVASFSAFERKVEPQDLNWFLWVLISAQKPTTFL